MSVAPAEVLPIHSKPTASFVLVTPEVAQRWLELNKSNRNISKRTLDRYKRDMVAGNWQLDGSPIRFSGDNVLLDGQHRLTAIVQTGVTLPLLVVRGVSADAQPVMDTGKGRTAADALAMCGHKNAAIVAAAARLAIDVESGRLGSGSRGEVSHSEVLAVIDANPDLAEAADFTSTFARKTDCPPSVVAYTYLILRRIDPKEAAEFWVGVAEKVGLDRGDPILALSHRLAEARRSREALSRGVLVSMVFRAWNARRDGKELHRVQAFNRKGEVVTIPKPH
jgi:hypothetical protein